MPVEAKPLFRPDVLRSHLKAFKLPAIDSPRLNQWARDIASGKINRFGEQEILPQFLNDVFVGLLGYRAPVGHDRYTIAFQRHVEADGKIADAALGDFNGHRRYVVALEGKGPRDPLERLFAGRPISAVDQGYKYAINLPCNWIIVTSIRQTRLSITHTSTSDAAGSLNTAAFAISITHGHPNKSTSAATLGANTPRTYTQ